MSNTILRRNVKISIIYFLVFSIKTIVTELNDKWKKYNDNDNDDDNNNNNNNNYKGQKSLWNVDKL